LEIGSSGVCGLTNLGNTCFINSALQCLSNIPILTKFVMEDYNQMRSYLNIVGIKRKKLFDYYCDVIKQIWTGNNMYISPNQFRQEITTTFPQFPVYEQKDCCEFLILILEKFHEELNQYNHNKDVQINWQLINKSENFLEYLRSYKLVNKSFISENFHGIQKMSLKCTCNKSFVTDFMPFSSLNLPYPRNIQEVESKNHENLNIIFMPLIENNQYINLFKIKLYIPKNGIKVREISSQMAKVFNEYFGKSLNSQNLLVTEVVADNLNIKIVYGNDDSIFPQHENIYIFEIDPKYQRQFFVNLGLEKFETFEHLPILINVDSSNYDSIMKVFAKIFTEFPHPCGEEIETTRQIIESSIKLRFFLRNKLYNYNSTDIYELPQHSILLAEIPKNLVRRYQSGKIYFHDLNSNEPKFLECTSNKAVSLYDCLDKYLAIEELSKNDRMSCNYCHLYQVPTKKLELVYVPNVLLLQLKTSKNTSRRHRDILLSSTNNTYIDFPLELSLDNYVLQQSKNESLTYDLIAVSNHSGSNCGGHYTTYAKNYKNNKWYSFNDSYVNEISDKQLVTQNAYLLVYMKRQNKKC
jgi:ubiquitin carboxyl-terminal hydrolase 4/11/15